MRFHNIGWVTMTRRQNSIIILFVCVVVLVVCLSDSFLNGVLRDCLLPIRVSSQEKQLPVIKFKLSVVLNIYFVFIFFVIR